MCSLHKQINSQTPQHAEMLPRWRKSNDKIIMLLGFQVFHTFCLPKASHMQLWDAETSESLSSLKKASSAECPLFPRTMQEKYTPLGLKSYITKPEEYTRCFLILKIKKLRPKLAYQRPRRGPGPQLRTQEPKPELKISKCHGLVI